MTKSTTKTAIKKPTKSLTVLIADTNKAIAKKGTATFEIGNALLHAKGHFLKKSKVVDAEAWLAWVLDNFQIKKAQANNYVKVVQVFGTKKAFQGLSTQVLCNLMRDEKMVTEAGKMLAEGKEVTNKWTVEYKKAKDDACETKKAKRLLDKKNAQIKADLEAEELKKNAPITISKERLAKAKASLANEQKALEALKAANIVIEQLKKELAEAKKSSTAKTKTVKTITKPIAKKATEAEIQEVKERTDHIVDCENKVKMQDKKVMTKKGAFKKTFVESFNPITVAHCSHTGLTKRYTELFKKVSK